MRVSAIVVLLGISFLSGCRSPASSRVAARGVCSGPYPDLTKLEYVRGRVATLEDVSAGRAAFTSKGHPESKAIDVVVPQYVCCHSDGKDVAGALIQAESGPGVLSSITADRV